MLAQVVSSAGSGLDSCVASLGGDPGAVGVGPDTGEFAPSCQKTIPLVAFAARLESAAKLTRRPDLGLHFAQSFDMRRLGLLGHLMHCAETVRDSLEAYVAYYSRIQSDTEVALSVSGGTASVSYRVKDPAVSEGRQDAEFSTGIVFGFVFNACGADWQHGALAFAHAPQRGRAELLAQSRAAPFGICPVFNAATNSVQFPERYLECRNPLADAELADILLNHLRFQPALSSESDNLIQSLKHIMKAEILGGRGVTIEQAARRLGVSTRYLQRHCALHGSSFRVLRNEAIVAIASEWLQFEKRSVTDVALNLGFSEASSFSRAFRNCTGLSPRELKTN